MTREEKDLLLKDLCARLPYGVKIHAKYVDTNTEVEKSGVLSIIDADAVVAFTDGSNCYNYVAIHEVKPYLFPLPSMTDEQYNKFNDMGYSVTENYYDSIANYHQIDWFIKNHFDYRGLINKGLAIDCTHLDIY